MIDIMVGYVWCYILYKYIYINLAINNRFKKPNGFIIYIFKTSFFFFGLFFTFLSQNFKKLINNNLKSI